LLSGPLRNNLSETESDELIWRCLRDAGIEKLVRGLPGQLDFLVVDGGGNFSAGERQLIALARALITQDTTSLLLCDEATANVDLETDEKVHDVIFSLKTTVVMICHRLQHIHRFDKVAVLDSGSLVEFGRPSELTKKPNGVLSEFFRRANIPMGKKREDDEEEEAVSLGARECSRSSVAA